MCIRDSINAEYGGGQKVEMDVDWFTTLAAIGLIAVGYGLVRTYQCARPCAPWCWDTGHGTSPRQRIDLDQVGCDLCSANLRQVQFPPELLWGVCSPGAKPVDTTTVQQLGLNAHRITLDWASIEPEDGSTDEHALTRYSGHVDDMVAAGITPVITLHSGRLPEWVRARGGWQQASSGELLVRHATMLFERFRGRVKYWVTIDDPVELVLLERSESGLSDAECCRALANLMDAHVQLYTALKSKVGGPHAQVGMVVQVMHFEPHRWWHPGDLWATVSVQKAMSAPIEMLRTGQLSAMFGKESLRHNNQAASKSSDFVGLSYFGVQAVEWSFGGVHTRCGQYSPLTDTGMNFLPEGLCFALQQLNRLKLPMVVARHGIADRADALRLLFLRRSLHAMSVAMQQGCMVLGYFYCSIYDEDGVRGLGVRQLGCGLVEGSRSETAVVTRPSARYLAQFTG
eukprot:TRINITY_DN28896_c0_g1_i1.p1 TRINITY_DN28896_c0_g1~~TRINITY_DN28896_c0_g1_i1.p1  ORF type:complete len:456 (-),score=78.57 TRINITY_DN28896_c0_g1_i1:264-1631(-)